DSGINDGGVGSVSLALDHTMVRMVIDLLAANSACVAERGGVLGGQVGALKCTPEEAHEDLPGLSGIPAGDGTGRDRHADVGQGGRPGAPRAQGSCALQCLGAGAGTPQPDGGGNHGAPLATPRR